MRGPDVRFGNASEGAAGTALRSGKGGVFCVTSDCWRGAVGVGNVLLVIVGFFGITGEGRALD